MTRTNKKVRYSHKVSTAIGPNLWPWKTCAPDAAKRCSGFLKPGKMAISPSISLEESIRNASHAFSELERAIPCHLAEDAYSAVARAGARWIVLRTIYLRSAQGGIPADKGWNSTPSALRALLAWGRHFERAIAAVFIAAPHLKAA